MWQQRAAAEQGQGCSGVHQLRRNEAASPYRKTHAHNASRRTLLQSAARGDLGALLTQTLL